MGCEAGLQEKSLREIIGDVRARLGEDVRVAFVSGNFNILHPGHFRLLRFAADSADALVVGVFGDAAAGVAAAEAERLAGVLELSMVDAAFILREPVQTAISLLKPDVVVKGKEYETRTNPEQKAVAAYGGKLLFSSGEMRLSSPKLLEQEMEADFSTIRFSDEYLERHAVSADRLKSGLRAIQGLRVLVIGDLIVDSYITCDPLGMSQEDPTLVITPIEEHTFLGGAGIVAAHAAGLGGQARLISVCGEDDKADFAMRTLQQFDVIGDLLVDYTRPTTHKLRYRAKGKTLLRVNHLRQHPVDKAIGDMLVQKAEAALSDADLLLFSDFNYGCLPQPVVDQILRAARRREVIVCADSQASSQNGDISRFRGMDLIAPTEHEARMAMRDYHSGLVILAEALQKKAEAEHLLITLGAEGLLAYSRRNGEFFTDRLPAFNTAPKDPAGAGDALFVSTAMAMRAGLDFWNSAVLGSLAAACQVSRVGNTPLAADQILAELDDMNR